VSTSYLRLIPGTPVLHQGHRYVIHTLLGGTDVYCLDQAGSNHRVLRMADLRPMPAEDAQVIIPNVAAISSKKLAISDKRLEHIQDLIGLETRTREQVEAAAKKAGVDTATIYRWLKRYTNAGSALGLVPLDRGPGSNTLISKEVETLIREMIERLFLTKQKISVTKFAKEVRRTCKKLKLKAPHDNTIRNRLKTIPGIIRASRRGTERDREKHTATTGTSPQGAFLQSDYQIDHTLLPLIVVDDEHRKPINRPWITVVIEVKTRVVAGFYLSLGPPSTESVAMALANAICPKEDYLASLGIDAEWPVWGMAARLHADNALEFRSEALVLGLREFDRDMQWRPVKKPRYGAYIERLLGTLGIELTSWQGATFSNPADKGDYDAVGNAIFTMREVERRIALWIAKIYHHSRHDGLEGRTPMGCFMEGVHGDGDKVGDGFKDRPSDPQTVARDFMRVERRKITSAGVSIDGVNYYSPELSRFVGESNQWDPDGSDKYLFRIDDRAISPIFFFNPIENRYIEVPYAKTGRPVISTWQLKAAKAFVRTKGIEEFDEDKIFDAYEELEADASEAAETTKSLRSAQRRADNDRRLGRAPAAKPPTKVDPPNASTKAVDAGGDDDALPPQIGEEAAVISG